MFSLLYMEQPLISTLLFILIFFLLLVPDIILSGLIYSNKNIMRELVIPMIIIFFVTFLLIYEIDLIYIYFLLEISTMSYSFFFFFFVNDKEGLSSEGSLKFFISNCLASLIILISINLLFWEAGTIFNLLGINCIILENAQYIYCLLLIGL